MVNCVKTTSLPIISLIKIVIPPVSLLKFDNWWERFYAMHEDITEHKGEIEYNATVIGGGGDETWIPSRYIDMMAQLKCW